MNISRMSVVLCFLPYMDNEGENKQVGEMQKSRNDQWPLINKYASIREDTTSRAPGFLYLLDTSVLYDSNVYLGKQHAL